MADKPVPEQDPIVTKSYAKVYVISTVALLVTLFWALWDEAWGQRPWKQYQSEFRSRYSTFLKTARSQSAQSQKEIEDTPEYQKLDAAVREAENQAKPRMKELNDKLRDVNSRIDAVQHVFTDRRAYVSALTYEIETEHSSKSKESKQRELDKYKAQEFLVESPGGSRKKLNYTQLEDSYNQLRDEKARISGELAELLKPITEAKEKRDAYVAEHMVSLTPEQVRGIQEKLRTWDPKLIQINVAEANIVDRCESCHLGVREPLKLTPAAVSSHGSKPDAYARAFVSHPEPDLLKVHDPEKFGCSPCHQGNGRAVSSVEKAHGEYKHWLWPLFRKANMEAGCQGCHAADMTLHMGSVGRTISAGKYLFRQRGCVGCHRYEGYDTEPEQLLTLGQQIKQFEQQKRENLLRASVLMKEADQAADNEEANRLNQQAEMLKVENSRIDGRIEQADLRTRSLMRDMKKVGPNLKDVRAKLNKNWIPVWLHKPTDFRPTTKMPNFRLNEQQFQEISAYLWRNALKDPLPQHKPGNAARGKELFETRGCLACHSIGEGDQMQGGDFAANLTRVGEKANYDYLVRWIHNPRERTRPYCPYEKKDIGPEDYARHGLPYVFDEDHSKCPNDGHELQIQNMTVMPSLRLPVQDAEDIATYLLSEKKKEPGSYPEAPYMDDAKVAERGKQWIRHFGCAGCHEIAGFEEEGRIGTELTQEGSKPIERLDFALLTQNAENGGKDPLTGEKTGPWYNHKGFFEHKLAKPDIYDQGKIKTETEKLRMPDPHLTKEQIRSLTTFLLGSQETSLPVTYQYRPEDARRDIQEGFWIVRKYNCVGCHQIADTEPTALMKMTRYQDPDWKEQLPPQLLTEGARVDPEWLMRFLANPALSTTDTNRNGVRPYLKARMPTFYFSQDELRKLVRFFQAMSQQPMPYVPEKVPVLTAKEQEMGRSLFSSQAAPCLKCHATGDPQHDKTAIAPNFLLVKERLKPGWTERWMIDPQSISPGTSMPSGLFRKEGERWVFNAPTPPSFEGYKDDHTKLLVRYLFFLTPEEQRRVSGKMASRAAKAPSSASSGVGKPGGTN